MTGDATLERALAAVTVAARVLPAEGFLQRISDRRPQAECEAFLMLVREQVLARADGRDQGYSLETELRPAGDGLIGAARALAQKLETVEAPMRLLAERLAARLDDEAAELDEGTRVRIEAAVRGLVRRGAVELGGWRRMLEEIEKEGEPHFVDWLAVDRIDGHETDIGHAPPLGRSDAALRRAGGEAGAWRARHLGDLDRRQRRCAGGLAGGRGAHRRAPSRRGRRCARECRRRSTMPPQTRVFIVTDVRRDDHAPGGGGLSRAVPGRGRRRARASSPRSRACAPSMPCIAEPLERAGLPLLAQHVDGMDTATLVDIFRAEEDASLLGTDAVRDGVDVPGRSLRLIVFDRVPWPRPDILHKARRAGIRRRALRRQPDAAALAAGVRPAGAPRRRLRRLRAARPDAAVAAARRLSRWRADRAAGP